MEKIRTISPDDADLYLAFARSVIVENEFVLTHIDDFNITIDDERQWIGFVLNNENNVNLIAEFNAEIIGSIHLLQHENKKEVHITELSINVHRNFRNRGIGKRLLKEALAMIKNKEQINKIVLQVFKNNHRAIHLYSLFGFINEGELVKQVCVEKDRYENIILMRLFKSDIQV